MAKSNREIDPNFTAGHAAGDVSYYYCEDCGEDIFAGEKFYIVGSLKYCANCVHEEIAGEE